MLNITSKTNCIGFDLKIHQTLSLKSNMNEKSFLTLPSTSSFMITAGGSSFPFVSGSLDRSTLTNIRRDKTKSRSISTVEGSGATCTRNFFELFFKTGDLSMVQLTQKMQKNSKRWKKRQKCIDITLRKWSWRPLWQVGKKTCWRFHRPPGELFEGFGIFPHLSTCLRGVEKSQTLQKVHLVACGSVKVLV